MRKKRDNKFITIKDVAAEAGVSIATVSRVINDGKVKFEKRKLVLDAIEKLNYVPNTSARNLASVSKTKRITLVIPDISTEYYSEVIKGFKEIVKVYKYDPNIDSYNYDLEVYHEVNKKYELSSEVKGVVQIGPKIDLEHKIIINWDSEHITYTLSELSKLDYAIHTDDVYIKEFFLKKLKFKLEDYTDEKKYSNYLAPTLQEALHLYNKGIRGDIYTFAPDKEIKKICPNIKNLNFDFYALGVTLARIAMKKINDEDVKTINI